MRYTPKTELLSRINKLQEKLQQRDIDGAVIIQRADLFYFAGTAQQAHLFVPAQGQSFLLTKKSYPRARQESALDNVLPMAKIKELPSVIKSASPGKVKRLGFELDVLPTSMYFKYKELFHPAELVDISQTIRSIRASKSAYELDLIRQAAGLNTILFEHARNFLREGVTEVELAGQLEAVYRKHGHQGYVRARAFNSELMYGHLMSGWNLGVPTASLGPTGGSGLNPSFPQGASTKTIGRNEPVMVDYVGVSDGYMVDQARIFCLGALSQELYTAHQVALEIQELVVQRGRPGVTCGELYELAVQKAAQNGLEQNFMGYPEPVPFIGHGVGIELDELPVLARGSKSVLEEGMVIALEPKFIFPHGAAGIENTFVVTKDGLEKITIFEEAIINVES